MKERNRKFFCKTLQLRYKKKNAGVAKEKFERIALPRRTTQSLRHHVKLRVPT